MVIGCVCKYGDVFSLAVLIDRGLDQQAVMEKTKSLGVRATRCVGFTMVQAYLESKTNLYDKTLFSFQGIHPKGRNI